MAVGPAAACVEAELSALACLPPQGRPELLLAAAAGLALRLVRGESVDHDAFVALMAADDELRCNLEDFAEGEPLDVAVLPTLIDLLLLDDGGMWPDPEA